VKDNEIRNTLIKIDNILSKEDYNELEKYCLEIADELDYEKLNGILFYEALTNYLFEKEFYLGITGSYIVHGYFNHELEIPGIEIFVELKNKTEINIGISIGIRFSYDNLDLSAYNLILDGKHSKKHFSDVIINEEEDSMYRVFSINEDFGSKESHSEMIYLKNYLAEIEAKCWDFVLPRLNLPKEN
jgi:hypothetical protein